VTVPVFRLTVFFAVVTSVFAAGTLSALVGTAQAFALAIQQQLAAVQSITKPTELAEKTISYAAAKTAYYRAFRAAMPELTDIATGKKPRPPEVDQFGQAFLLSGEKLEKVTDEATAALLSKLPLDSYIQKAKAAFEQAQAVEEQFLRDFDGVDFTSRRATPGLIRASRSQAKVGLMCPALRPLRHLGTNRPRSCLRLRGAGAGHQGGKLQVSPGGRLLFSGFTFAVQYPPTLRLA
jgi:hypothetical protein